MKFDIKKTSKWFDEKPTNKATYNTFRKEWEIEINTLEELLELSKTEGEEIIIEHRDIKGITRHQLEIYDDYRE